MKIEEILNWMGKEITFWYMETNGKKEIIYPLTVERQKVVQAILKEDADVIVYKNKFYFIEKDIEKTINKTSYTYYMREATNYKKRKAISTLPYGLKEKKEEIIRKLIYNYKENNIPSLLVVINNIACLKDVAVEILNPFTYINLSDEKLVLHKDTYLNKNDQLIILLTDINSKKLIKKCCKLKKKLKKCLKEKSQFTIINDYDNIIEFISTNVPID